MLVQQPALRPGQPRHHDRFHFAFLDVLVTHRAVAKLPDDVLAVVFGDGRKLELGAMLAKQAQPQQPLLDTVIPIRQRQTSGNNLIGQQLCRLVGRRWVNAFGRERQAAKFHQFRGLHPLGLSIELDMQIEFHVFRVKFAQPVRFNGRGEGKNGVHFPALDFADFGGNKKRAVLHGAFARQHAAAIVNQFTT